MHKRSIPHGLLYCRRCTCRHIFPIRQFHNSYITAEEQSNPSQRRGTTRAAASRPQGLTLRKVLASGQRQGQEPQVSRTQTDSPPRNSGPQKEVYRRVNLQQARPPGSPPVIRKDASPAAPQGRVRDRGARPPPQRQRRPRARNTRAADEGDEEESDETTHYEYLSLEHGDSFANIEEINNYAQVLDLLSSHKQLEERISKLETYKRSPKTAKSMSPEKLEEMEREIEEETKQIDELIPEALQHVVDTEEKFLPRHEPVDYSVTAPGKGRIGGTPIGTPGMGQLLEDCLRYLARREGDEWQDPKQLATKLAAGDFVKFRNANEMNDVMRLAEEIEWQQGQDISKENVGFQELDDAARKKLVETLVRGRYQDPKDKDLKSSLAKKIARLASGNATYPAASKEMLLSTIREILPEARAPKEASQSGKQKT